MNQQGKMTEKVVDDLTGLNHHTQYRKKIEQEINRLSRFASKQGGLFSVLLIELGNLDYYVEKFGQEVKDFILVEFSGVLKKLSRSLDFLSRYDNEVFAVILEETDEEGAAVFANRLLTDLNMLDYFKPKIEEFLNQELQIPTQSQLFCNIGIYTYTTEKEHPIDDIIKITGKALMKAIESGKNQYHITYDST